MWQHHLQQRLALHGRTQGLQSACTVYTEARVAIASELSLAMLERSKLVWLRQHMLPKHLCLQVVLVDSQVPLLKVQVGGNKTVWGTLLIPCLSLCSDRGTSCRPMQSIALELYFATIPGTK